MIRTLKQMAVDVAALCTLPRYLLLAWLELGGLVVLYFIVLGIAHNVLSFPGWLAGAFSGFVTILVIWIMSAWRRSRGD